MKRQTKFWTLLAASLLLSSCDGNKEKPQEQQNQEQQKPDNGKTDDDTKTDEDGKSDDDSKTDEDANSDDDAKTDDDGKSDDDGKTDEEESKFDEEEDVGKVCDSSKFKEFCHNNKPVYCAMGEDEAEIIKIATCSTVCLTSEELNRADCALDLREDTASEDYSVECVPGTIVNYCKEWNSFTKTCIRSAEDGKTYWFNTNYIVCNGGCGENGLCIEDDSYSDYEIWD